MKITSDIVVTYKNNVIHLSGPGISADVEMTSAELRKMYWGKEGKGKLTADIDTK